MQPQGHVQVLLNILRGWSPQDALDAPRFCISAGLLDAPIKNAHGAGDINSEVYFEPGIPEGVVSKLKGGSLFCCTTLRNIAHLHYTEMGHDAKQVKGIGRSMMGRGQVIQKLKCARLVWAAGSDLRADGHAVAQI